MENDHIKHILGQLESGQLTASDAYDQLKLAPFEDLGYAKVDHHREVRQGAPEVIYGASKTKEQMGGIINSPALPLQRKYPDHKTFDRIRGVPVRTF